MWFWIAAALSTLTKGPLGPLIGALGLLSRPWRGGGGQRRPALAHALGAVLFLAIAGGWALAAYLDSGQAFVDKVLGKELVGHAVQSGKGDPPLVNFYKSPAYFLRVFAPWSVIALIGALDLWSRYDDERRRLVRFLIVWMLGGLALFAASPHQRGDLLTPIWAPAGALAGVVVARWIAGWRAKRCAVGIVAVITLTLGVVYVHRHHLEPRGGHFERAQKIEAMADTLIRAGRVETMRPHTGHSYLEYVLGRMTLRLDGTEARAWLRADPSHAVSVSKGPSELEDELGIPEKELTEVAAVVDGGFTLRIVSMPSGPGVDARVEE